MPELPDLVYIEKHLAHFLPGKRIKAVEIKEPIVLRALISEGFEGGLKNACFQKVYRHGPFLTFTFESDLDLVIHPMLAGKFKIAENADKPGRSMCFSLHLDDGSYFNYLDDRARYIFLPKLSAGQKNAVHHLELMRSPVPND